MLARPTQELHLPRVGLIVPALDEEQALPQVLAELPPGVVSQIVVVDNGSRDRTAEVARACGAHVVSEAQRGYGSACLAGLAALLGEHADPQARVAQPLGDGDTIVFLDADHSDYPEEIELLLEPLHAGRADLVIGSRILGGASLKAMLPQAWFGNRLACLLMRMFFGLRATDLGPFRAIGVTSLRALEMRDRDFGWTVEMQLKAHVQGLRTLEVPVRYRPRVGTSKITGTLWGSLRAGTKILSWILGWRLRLGRPRR